MPANDSACERESKRIEALGRSKDLDGLERAGEAIERDSARFGGECYFALMSKLCDEISSWDFGDRVRQKLLEERFANLALRKPDAPLEMELRLLLHLHEVPASAEARGERAERWLRGWSRLRREIDPEFDAEDVPALNVAPPVETGLPPGTDPSSIRDPELRKRYEAAIAENDAKARRYTLQHELRGLERTFVPRAERFLVDAYSRPRADSAELEQLLERHIDDAELRRRILTAVARARHDAATNPEPEGGR